MSRSGTNLPQQEIYDKLMAKYSQYFNTLDKNYIDPYEAIELIKPKHYNYKELNKIYAQLLNYTYAASAREVKNHEEVTAILKEIRNTLIKDVNPQQIPQSVPPGW